MPGNDITVVDLFCGVGGLSLGLREAGLKIIAAFDSWGRAVTVYRKNLGDHVGNAGVSTTLSLPAATVIAGGPPCQGFSSAGMRRHGDHRNTLVRSFTDIIVKAMPRAFIFENVEGFLTGSGGQFVFDLLEPLIAVGYRIHLRKINAANYGVPQHRKRVIALGGLGWSPNFPPPTHSAFGAPGAELAGSHLTPTPSVDDALEGLPEAATRENGSRVALDHSYSPLKPDDLGRAALLKAGQRMRDLPEEHWHESYKRRAFRRVMDGTPTERRGGAPAGVRRLAGDEPSKAITGGAINEFLHPNEHRPLTIRECARLQTFPDSFTFSGARRDDIQLIGNAVPPLLARRIGECLAVGLRSATEDDAPGALLTFVPTLSTGMSPILRRITEQVRDRFQPCGSEQLQLSFS